MAEEFIHGGTLISTAISTILRNLMISMNSSRKMKAKLAPCNIHRQGSESKQTCAKSQGAAFRHRAAGIGCCGEPRAEARPGQGWGAFYGRRPTVNLELESTELDGAPSITRTHPLHPSRRLNTTTNTITFPSVAARAPPRLLPTTNTTRNCIRHKSI